MIRRLSIATAMFIGLGALVFLINATISWCWVYAFFERDRIRLHSGRNLLLCLAGVLLIAVAELVLGRLFFRSLFPRRFPGRCHECGYNLTGNISGRCPECGTHTPGSQI